MPLLKPRADERHHQLSLTLPCSIRTGLPLDGRSAGNGTHRAYRPHRSRGAPVKPDPTVTVDTREKKDLLVTPHGWR